MEQKWSNRNLTEDESEHEKKEAELALIKQLRLKYCETSLNKFGLDSPTRQFAISILSSDWFDKIIILLIAINSVLLGLIDYTVDRNNTAELPYMNRLCD